MAEEIKYEDKLRKYTFSELEDVERNIDREEYPDRYELILKEKEYRKNNPGYIVEESKTDSIFSPDWNKNIVDDNNSPLLYSKHAVYGFSVFFSVLFGGVLLISNLKTIKNLKPKIILWLYIILYTVFTITMISIIPNAHSLPLLLNIMGAIPLYNYFWKKFIGAERKYRKKSITKPLLISLLIIVPFVIASFL